MNTRADKSQENKSQSVSSERVRQLEANESSVQFSDACPESIAQRKLQALANNSPQVSKLKAIHTLISNNQKSTSSFQLKKISEFSAGDLVKGTEYKIKKGGGGWQYAAYDGLQGVILQNPTRFVDKHSFKLLHDRNATTLDDTDEFEATDRSADTIAAEKAPKTYDEVVARLKAEWDSIKGGFNFNIKNEDAPIVTGFWGRDKENATLTADASAALTEEAIAASIGLDTDKLKIVVGGSHGAAGAMHILIQRKNLAIREKSYLNFHMMKPA